MNYNRQVEEITKYIRNGEKEINDFRIGVEFEHFVIDKYSLKTISYYGKDGVGETLKSLEKSGWEGSYEGEYILGLNKGNKTITLEPGSQLELSIKASSKIEDIEKEYMEFLKEIISVLEDKNQGLVTTAYHPLTKIDDIRILPKKRYDLMFNYFKTKGTHAHNMMKGTAALQVSMDYSSEEDYRKKFRVANALSPVMFALLDNGFFFEGDIYNNQNLRAHIWNNCDNDRSGIVDNALDDGFSYEDYAKYILNRPPIFIMKEGKIEFTGDKKAKDIFDPENYKKEELEHILTMFFPDVRTKKYIEIRMMDSVPYPLNFAAVALWKGLIYNEDNLNLIYDYIKDIKIEDIKRIKEEMMIKGLDTIYKDKTIIEMGKWLVELAKKGLHENEVKYVYPLENMLQEGKNPYEITKENNKYGREKALNWCLLNNIKGVF